MATMTVLGSGGWGTAVAVHLARMNRHTVRMWCLTEETAKELRDTRQNARLLPGVELPESLHISASEAVATENSDVWIFAIPTVYLKSAAQRFQQYCQPTTKILSLTKGIENATFLRPTEILAAHLPSREIAVLSGPSHAEEVAKGFPTSVVVAAENQVIAEWMQQEVGNERLRIYTSPDVVGVELSGALKNVMGVAAGICEGLGLGDNAKAALIARGLIEMQRFGVSCGAKPETFTGLAGIGDLMATCYSPHGRNRRVGLALAEGKPLAEILSGPQVAEGVNTAKSVYEHISKHGIESPIFQEVYRILYEGLSPKEAVIELLSRPQRDETWS